MRKSSSIALSTTSPPSSTAHVVGLVPSLEWISTRPLAVLRVFTRCFSSPPICPQRPQTCRPARSQPSG
eukprot:2872433-Prymnesium_polylepis.1